MADADYTGSNCRPSANTTSAARTMTATTPKSWRRSNTARRFGCTCFAGVATHGKGTQQASTGRVREVSDTRWR